MNRNNGGVLGSHLARVTTFTLRAAALALFIVYLGWNVLWLTQGRLGPSLFLAVTGLPCPTTGVTRSLDAMISGEWGESLKYNAMALPIVALLGFCIVWLVVRCVRTQRLVLPNWVLTAWMLLLATAWILKLTGDPSYW